MNFKHYINFGTAKTASSWLYTALGFTDVKEPDFEFADIESYQKYFEHKNFSTNFNTNLWKLDSNQISILNSVATHKTVIFRNPFEYADSLYNFWQSDIEQDIFLSRFELYFDYAKILSRLPDSTVVLFYDDIKSSPQQVVDQLCNYLDIERVVAPTEYINVTNYTKNLLFNKNQSTIFNSFVSRFEDSVKKDLGHWKQDV